ncbi:exonuclease SbcCD subunit D [Alicyclobacillus macrosporangiidus]|uniref:exonuclease SbcCD subunit D n=1 Tax=Alicyclobacillus macrosporangiidus TaxID=392015 RepID=UPI0004970653|nr:exonuclease SbcCD subunit D [Alicyclobacillus macrosporangiidus]
MRILHTADWHFGKTLEGRDRLPEQAEFVDELCRLCDDERIDAVLMAGDVYQTVNPSAQAEALFYEALHRLADGGRRAVVVIAGNHDNPERLAAAAPIAEVVGVTLIGLPKTPISPATGGPGKVARVAGGPSWLELALPGSDAPLVVAALPYPSEARLNEVLADGLDEADLRRGYSERVAAWFRALSRRFRPDTVNIAMSHLYVQGGLESDSEIQIQVGGAYAVDPLAFPEDAQYVALGHLHRPQAVAGSPVPARYSGSPLAYSFSEAGQTKSVVILDAAPGRPIQLGQVALGCGRPLVRWIAEDGVPQVIRWVEEGRDAQAWIDLELHLREPLSLQETQMLRSLHPGFVHIRPVLPEQEAAAVRATGALPPDQLFRRFFERRHGAPPDDALVQLFLELLAEASAEDDWEALGEEVAG